MKKNPSRFPAAAIDKIISGGQDVGIADFMLHMELCFEHRLDAQRLERSLLLLLDAQPVLGCRLVTKQIRAYWEQLTGPRPDMLCLASNTAEFDTFRNSPIESRRGPQLKACLLHAADGDRLLVKVAHQVCDAGGLNAVVAQLANIYTRLTTNPDYRPRPNIHGARSCRQIMQHLPWHIYPVLLFLFLRTLLSTQIPRRTHALQVPAGPREPFTFVIRHLAPAHVERLKSYGRRHQATINDMMIAAFYRALLKKEDWNGLSALRIQITVDLRRQYLPSGRAEGICNLSTYEHINLGREPGSDFAATLDRVSAINRRSKSGWIGLSELCMVPLAGLAPYRLLVKACSRLLHERLSSRNYPSGLTNLGRIPPAGVFFDGQPARGWVLPPVVYPPVLYIGFSGYANTLTLSAGVPLAARACIEDFFSQLLEELPA
ncbi:MAG: hypothetical protein WCQ99_14895 [Pseudomonadota bacterium]